jgi:hypothetical protein
MTKQRYIPFKDGVKLLRPKLQDWHLESIALDNVKASKGDWWFLKFYTKETQSLLIKHITEVAKFELELRHKERFADVVRKGDTT